MGGINIALFKISFVTTGGQKWDLDKKEAHYIKETRSGYALIDTGGNIIYTVPEGLIVEKMEEFDVC